MPLSSDAVTIETKPLTLTIEICNYYVNFDYHRFLKLIINQEAKLLDWINFLYTDNPNKRNERSNECCRFAHMFFNETVSLFSCKNEVYLRAWFTEYKDTSRNSNSVAVVVVILEKHVADLLSAFQLFTFHFWSVLYTCYA
jgi:hypothetical protein